MENMVKGVSWLILKIEMGHLWGWGTWPMGYMGNGAHEHNLGHMGNGKHGQRVSWLILQIEMGYLGDGAHGQWGTWAMGHMGIT